MTNSEKFKDVFGLYATELWAMPEEDFLNWINTEYKESESAQPERKKGEWIDLKCNQCGQVDMSKPNFCPNCVADMRGKTNEG